MKLPQEHSNISRICLPDARTPISDDQTCYIVGFGFTTFNGSKSDNLRHSKINLVPIDTCNEGILFIVAILFYYSTILIFRGTKLED